jgi:hypothetical protein
MHTSAILQMLRDALVEIRYLIRQGYAAQAGDLADAVHNVPAGLAAGTLDLERLLGSVDAYEQKYRGMPDSSPLGRAPVYDYPTQVRVAMSPGHG